ALGWAPPLSARYSFCVACASAAGSSHVGIDSMARPSWTIQSQSIAPSSRARVRRLPNLVRRVLVHAVDLSAGKELVAALPYRRRLDLLQGWPWRTLPTRWCAAIVLVPWGLFSVSSVRESRRGQCRAASARLERPRRPRAGTGARQRRAAPPRRGAPPPPPRG